MSSKLCCNIDVKNEKSRNFFNYSVPPSTFHLRCLPTFNPPPPYAKDKIQYFASFFFASYHLFSNTDDDVHEKAQTSFRTAIFENKFLTLIKELKLMSLFHSLHTESSIIVL